MIGAIIAIMNSTTAIIELIPSLAVTKLKANSLMASAMIISV